MSTLRKIDRFVVQRSKWLRGSNDSVLLDFRGRMCCLGFACIAAGLTEDEISGHTTPVALKTAIPALAHARVTPSGTYENTLLSVEAMRVNDDSEISAADRESWLTQLFAAEGITLEFVE